MSGKPRRCPTLRSKPQTLDWFSYEHSSLFILSISNKKSYCIGTHSQSHKTFLPKFTHYFESYIFSQHRIITVAIIQWPSLQNIVSKFMPKKFYEIDPSVEERPGWVFTKLSYMSYESFFLTFLRKKKKFLFGIHKICLFS